MATFAADCLMIASKRCLPQLSTKYAGLEVNEAKRMRKLESGNSKLKKLLAEKVLENEAVRCKVPEKLSLDKWRIQAK